MAKTKGNHAGTAVLHLYEAEKLLIPEDDPDHPLHDPDRLRAPVDPALIASVLDRGVIVPVVVRLNGRDPAGYPVVEVVDGRQRVRAVRAANKQRGGGEPILVPTIRRIGTDADAMAEMIVTNEIRRGDPLLVRARKAKRLVDLTAVGVAARAFGVKAKTIKGWLALLDTDGAVQRAVELGDMSVETAAELAPLSRAEQRAALSKIRASGTSLRGETGKAAAKAAAGAEREGATPTPPTRREVPSRVWLKRLEAELGAEEARLRKLSDELLADDDADPEDSRKAREGWLVVISVRGVLGWMLEGRGLGKVGVVYDAFKAVRKRFARGK